MIDDGCRAGQLGLVDVRDVAGARAARQLCRLVRVERRLLVGARRDDFALVIILIRGAAGEESGGGEETEDDVLRVAH